MGTGGCCWIMVYGQRSSHIMQQKGPPTSNSWATWTICTKWLVPQTRKMCLGTTKHWLSGANPWRGDNMHGPHQSCRNYKLANPEDSQTSLIIFGILQFLLTFHIPIFTHRKTPEWTNQERHPMDLGNQATRHFWNAQEVHHIRTSAKTTPTRPTIWSLSRCFRVHHRSSPNAKGQNRQKTPSCLFL